MHHTFAQTVTALAVGAGFALAAPLAHAAEDAATAAPVVAAPVVIELYTSQGCSSCPPADALMNELAKRDDIIPLALHVDYWDYIGWKDIFANPQYADRQRAYANVAGERMIYTPQMIVGGAVHVVGYKPNDVEQAIEGSRNSLQSVPVVMSVEREDNTLHIDIEDLGDLPMAMRLQLVEFDTDETVEIERGENRGKTITYSNIVQEWVSLGDWTGGEPLDMQIALETDNPVAVILQEVTSGGPGQILAARRAN